MLAELSPTGAAEETPCRFSRLRFSKKIVGKENDDEEYPEREASDRGADTRL